MPVPLSSMSIEKRVPRLLLLLLLALLFAAACADADDPDSNAAASVTGSVSPTATPESPRDDAIKDVIEQEFSVSDLDIGFGSVWLEDHATGSDVYRMDPATGSILKRFPLERPCDIGIGLGSVWAAELDANRLARIDPRSNEVVARITGFSLPCSPVVVGNSVWLTNGHGVARVDPEKNKIVAQVDTGIASVIAAGEGALWAASPTDSLLHRIDPATNDIEATIKIPGGETEGLGPEVGLGSVWVTHGSAGTVTRIDASTNERIVTIETGAGAGRVAFGLGSVWVANYEAGTVSEIDPRTNEVVDQIETGLNPNGIAFGLGHIWVSNSGDNTITKLSTDDG